MRALYADDCQHCGMCCIYFGKFQINVESDGPQPPRKLVQIGRKVSLTPDGEHSEPSCNRWMRVIPDPLWAKGKLSRCVALTGTQGKDIRCSIYDDRPRGCREFDPGSDYCLRIREWGRLSPLVETYGAS